MLFVLALATCYYCCCCFWNTILEKKHAEYLFLKKRWKNAPNRSEWWFRRRTWLEELVLLYIIWTANSRILDMCQYQCGQMCSDMCNFMNMRKLNLLTYIRDTNCVTYLWRRIFGGRINGILWYMYASIWLTLWI